MHVAQARARADGGVERAVVELIVRVDLVEAENDVERGALGSMRSRKPHESRKRFAGGETDVADAALDEIAGERGLRKHDDVGEVVAVGSEACERVADRREIGVDVALAGRELHERQLEFPGMRHSDGCFFPDVRGPRARPAAGAALTMLEGTKPAAGAFPTWGVAHFEGRADDEI